MGDETTPRDLAQLKGRAELTFAEKGKVAGRTALPDRNQDLSSAHVGFEMPVGHPSADFE